MNLVYILDTNTISEPLKPKPNENVVRLLDKYAEQVAISSFVIYELIKGASQLPQSKRRQRILHYIDDVLSQLPVLPYTEDAAIWHGKETARLKSIGKTPPFLDAQIASVAKVNDLILVTRNINDFQEFSSLKLENWFE